MILGDPGLWLGQLFDIEARLVERIVVVWPQCLDRIKPDFDEDEITNVLVARLRKDPEARTLGGIYPQYALVEDEPHEEQRKGYIDIAVVMDNNPDVYAAFECKLLNTRDKKGKRSSLAGPYVEGGLVRYVIEQYAESLPVGAMLGYVLDGDISFAEDRIIKLLDNRPKWLNLPTGPQVTELEYIGSIRRFSTEHRRSRGGNIIVRHSLLPFPAPSESDS